MLADDDDDMTMLADHGMLKGSGHGTQSTMVKKTLNLSCVRILDESVL